MNSFAVLPVVVERLGKGLENWANEHASQIAAVAIAAGTVLTVAALVATGPVGLIVAGAAGGAFLSGGLSILTNRGADGRVDWKKVGLDTLIGGIAGGVGGAAVSVVGKAGAFINSARAARAAVGAERAGAKAVALGQKAASAMKINPMRYVNSWRAGNAARKAAELGARAERFAQVADRMGDVGGFARSMPGQLIQGVTSNVTSNNLTYAWGDFKEHTAGGYVRATGAGIGVGVVSPRITPLRQRALGTAAPSANILDKGLVAANGFAIDRSGDALTGMASYVVAPQDQDLSWEGALKEGFKNSVSGGSGTFGTWGANMVRPVK